jgi:hypothetical protein
MKLFLIHVSVRRATRLWIDNRIDYFLLHSIQTESAFHPAFYSLDKERSFSWNKSVGA